jgi:hypothetical protein
MDMLRGGQVDPGIRQLTPAARTTVYSAAQVTAASSAII